MLKDLFFRLRSVFRRETVECEMEEELRFHSERQLEKYLKRGMSRDEATGCAANVDNFDDRISFCAAALCR